MKLGPLSRERWRVLEPLLDAALELEPSERCAFIDDACRGDAALCGEVKALLLACECENTLLSTSATVAFASLLTESTRPLPAQLGGRYHLLREIGQGGMASVHLADDPKHGRQVAVKVLHAEVARLVGRERFRREIEIAARLSHPHILPLHDSGEVLSGHSGEHSFLYFVSPFAAGESLRDLLLREPRMRVDDAVRLGRQIALALDYAHRQGVIHLDIKPGNILLQEGHAVIADFGIARAMSNACDEAAAALPLLGTPAYMSPEQADGAPDVDARSDIYSLGCVLYEMVTGERPFARARSDEAPWREQGPLPPPLPPPPDAAALNADVSPALAAVIRQAMAPAREDRFLTAGELASALDAATHGGKVRAWRGKPVAIAWGVVTAIVGVLVALWASRNASAFDENLLAVAPFDVESPSLALWKEGMVDVMSRNLDRAGALRTVPPTVVVRRWQGRADAQSALALGQRTHAGLVLFGGLLAAGDSVRATVVLLDTRTGRALAEIERRDVPDRIDRLSDSLTVAVLRELGRARHTDLARATSSPTSSLPALKAYLQGEQFYRAGRWDSAQTHFERALGQDSAFALAYHRLAAVRRWRDPTDIPDSTTYALMRRTSHFPQGLAPRERLLATTDSLTAEAYFAWRRAIKDGDYTNEERIVRRLFATLGDGLRRYPSDPELAFLLAEARSRTDGEVILGELDDRAILALYDRAIALDPGFAPAYVKPISLAAYLEGAMSARRYIRAYLALVPSGAYSQTIRLADVLLDPARAASIDVAALVDTLPAEGLCEAATLLRHVPDATEIEARLARALADRRPDDGRVGGDPTCALMQAVDGLQFGGHLREAHSITSRGVHWLRPTVIYNMSRVGMIPAETSRVEFARILSLAPRTRMSKLYGWWAADGDTLSIQAYVTQFGETQSARRRPPTGLAMLRASVAAGRAYLALAKRDTAAALHQFLTTPDTLHECWYDNRLAVVQLLAAVGRYEEAGQRLARRWPGTSGCSNGFDDVVWTLERARVFERLGRRGDAVANYAFVVAAWRTADPELQRYVDESRVALARLGVALQRRVLPLGSPRAAVALVSG